MPGTGPAYRGVAVIEVNKPSRCSTLGRSRTVMVDRVLSASVAVWLWFCLAFPIGAVAQESFKCPDDFGFYPHHSSCDKYWKCDNNVAELKTCGNGLAFDATDSKYLTENCDYLHNVDCGDRTQLGNYATFPSGTENRLTATTRGHVS
uniref:Chitin-binding type-2 domain-containing protein n=1 Tax=Anopheles culicifacies TaxID=139723 RepID=A0A182M8J9_9DIPT